MRGRKASDDAPLQDVLNNLALQFGFGRTREDDDLAEAWRDAAGELASLTTVAAVRKGLLEIVAADSVVMQELSFQKHTLLEKMKEKYPDAQWKDIRFSVGKIN
ncbi:MAG: DUF721 domain-containing protein [Planctomycetia bacterium]|nr:DUF721 domain-containing protein [Planctomycetia bacterium]